MKTLVLYLSCLIPGLFAYPFLFNEKECKDMFPEQLRRDAEHSRPPYRITITSTIYKEYEEIDVRITATGTRRISGFFLQARRGDCGLPEDELNKPVGYFTHVGGQNLVKLVNCAGQDDSAVVNKDWTPLNTIKVRYVSPKKDVGPIYFRATVVDSEKVFWTKVFSPGIRYHKSSGFGMQCPTREFLHDDAFKPSLSCLSVILTLFVALFQIY